ncbi:hypothetical protein H8N01_01715 [Streptomyces sp. AC536]|uniref:immunity protein TriTu family protein n=1 Tax=Streptomyces buecherae TaxID=2763006 RepID=UPI00164D1631|nr:hypothetical protein [Streptomyces buecherae]MBC3981322.1 hypothetical protein [Streptomyces buecherae]QNJ41219.1 hypothetical protein H7H31_16455 [Streptomyces buecherae]
MAGAWPQWLSDWFAEHEERLRTRGILGDLRRSPADGRAKSSVVLTLETDGYITALTVWSSGETELEYGDVASGLVRQEHRELRTVRDLLDAVASIEEGVR